MELAEMQMLSGEEMIVRTRELIRSMAMRHRLEVGQSAGMN